MSHVRRRGTVRRGANERGVSRKRRAGGFSGHWSDDDDVADDFAAAPWQVCRGPAAHDLSLIASI